MFFTIEKFEKRVEELEHRRYFGMRSIAPFAAMPGDLPEAQAVAQVRGVQGCRAQEARGPRRPQVLPLDARDLPVVRAQERAARLRGHLRGVQALAAARPHRVRGSRPARRPPRVRTRALRGDRGREGDRRRADARDAPHEGRQPLPGGRQRGQERPGHGAVARAEAPQARQGRPEEEGADTQEGRINGGFGGESATACGSFSETSEGLHETAGKGGN